MRNIAPYRKFVAALVTAATIAIANGVVPADVVPYVNVAIALAGAYGVYAVPNAG